MQSVTLVKHTCFGNPVGPLCHNGHLFYKEKKLFDHTYYHCATRLITACDARLTVDESGEIELRQKHNYYTNCNEVEAKLVRQHVMEAIGFTYQGLPMAVLAHLPKPETVVRNANKIRAGNGYSRVPAPTSMEALVIPTELMSRGNENWLLNDSGQSDPSRYTLFGSSATFEHLKTSNIWLADGTFHVPHYVRQLWILHAVFKGGAVPCFFVVMSSKTLAAYCRVLPKIKEIVGFVEPRYVVSDFEMA